MVDVVFAERAVACQDVVDRLIQRRIIAGGIAVPDFEMARGSRLAQRLDLSKGDLRECHRAFVIVFRARHDFRSAGHENARRQGAIAQGSRSVPTGTSYFTAMNAE